MIGGEEDGVVSEHIPLKQRRRDVRRKHTTGEIRPTHKGGTPNGVESAHETVGTSGSGPHGETSKTSRFGILNLDIRVFVSFLNFSVQ